jgi:hypothetical protein
MLCVWNVRACDVDVSVAALDCVFDPMDLDSNFVVEASETICGGFGFEGGF